jgi:hypothetical protein
LMIIDGSCAASLQVIDRLRLSCRKKYICIWRSKRATEFREWSVTTYP